MDIVIDTSAIIAAIADEPERPALLKASEGHDLIAPLSVHYEIGNALASWLRQKRTTLDKALAALNSYDVIPIRFVDVELDESLRLAAQLQIYAYDSYLIRCAIRYRSPLITLDRKLRAKALESGVQIVEVLT